MRPVIKVYQKDGLIYNSQQNICFYSVENMFICFELDLDVELDVLIVCKNLTSENRLISTFKLMFHTGFSNQNVLHFPKEEIDGANNNTKYPEYFTIDLFFDRIEEIDNTRNMQIWQSVEKSRGNVRDGFFYEEKKEIENMDKFSIGDEDEEESFGV